MFFLFVCFFDNSSTKVFSATKTVLDFFIWATDRMVSLHSFICLFLNCWSLFRWCVLYSSYIVLVVVIQDSIGKKAKQVICRTKRIKKCYIKMHIFSKTILTFLIGLFIKLLNYNKLECL